MIRNDVKEYNQSVVAKILQYKWIRSEELGHDIGEDKACREWIQKYAKDHRVWWNDNHLFN